MRIKVADDFSRFPAGRTPKDGPNNGQRFRLEFLLRPLRAGQHVTVILDDTRSYGSSFLEEAFGGLVREEGFSKPELDRCLKIVAEKAPYARYKRLAEGYIRGAAQLAKAQSSNGEPDHSPA